MTLHDQLGVKRKGWCDYDGDPTGVMLAQMIELTDEFVASLIRADLNGATSLREHGYLHVAEALGL